MTNGFYSRLDETWGSGQIDFLKVDAEGHDLDVLVGFSRMLQAGKVRYVQVECGCSPDNLRHIPYDRIASFMFAFGYRLYGIFDGMPARKTGRPGMFYARASRLKYESRWIPKRSEV